MKDRLSKISKRATHALCLLAACGLTYSCADEYKLDDEAPSWLGSSIYNYLEKGNFKNFVKLIDDLNQKEVLSTTGSRTLFVANDSAFDVFYKENAARPASDPWANATSYDKLSLSQKKLLLNSAMLNNAYLMEMMSRAEGTVAKGTNMRKITSVELTDSITVLRPKLHPESLPFSYNTTDKNYWQSHKDKDKLYLVSDNSTPMMVFFSDDFMSKSNITAEDFEFIMKQKHQYNTYYIFDNKVINKDITCQNGYIHQMERVLLPQSNMAEVIRNNGSTNIFSHILDRFSAPYPDANLRQQYKDNVDPNFQDSIFIRKYYSQVTNESSITDYLEDGTLVKGPDKESPSPDFRALKIDPAWNQFKTGTDAATDMAAMFVPNDSALYDYFTKGEGRDIYNNYAENEDHGSYPDNLEPFYKNLDQIPMSILNSLVSNLMQKSFVESVPSKFTTILDQANDNLFPDREQTKRDISGVKIANNGVVYVMNKVYPPVDYAAVTSPAYIGENYKIMKFAIYNGEGSDGKSGDLIGLNFFAYLRAKGDGIKFSFFLPSDQALQNYVDPLSIIPGAPTKARVLSLTYDASKTDANIAPLSCKQYSYDVTTGVRGREIIGQVPDQSEYLNRLSDILETHTIVHNTDVEPAGIHSGNEYFLSKNGSPIRIKERNGVVTAQGGMQIENEKAGGGTANSVPGFYYSTTETEYEKSNGTTYCINAPIQPAVKSVYRTMSEMGNEKFFELCNSSLMKEVLEKSGTVVYDPEADDDDKDKELFKHFVFIKDGGLDNNVSFFTKFNYTIYVPTDAALEKEINEKKLPTWESIKAYIDQYENDPQWASVHKLRAQAQVAQLIDFIRGHFQDNSIFVDKKASAMKYYNSATMDGQKFFTIAAQQKQNGLILNKKLTVGNGNVIKDQNGKDIEYYNCEVTSKNNLIARDYITNVNYAAQNIDLKKSVISSASYSVLHEINGVLRTKTLKEKDDQGNYKDVTYEDLWKKEPQKIIARFRIKNK